MEVVETPFGKVEVLKPEEQFKRERERDLTKYLPVQEGDYSKGFECRKCGETIMVERVAHPIWNGPFPQSGSGQCYYEYIPYCPKCEERPDFYGSAIVPKGSFHNP